MPSLVVEVTDPGVVPDEARENVAEIEPVAPPFSLPCEVAVPLVRVHAPALNQIWDHARSSIAAEVGGVLAGNLALDDEQKFTVDVLGAVPATLARSRPGSLAFTAEAWDRLKTERLARYPDLPVVGWYHTHPGLGAFFSTTDLRLHQQEFGRQAWCVALVIDPVRAQLAVFWPSTRGVALCPVTLIDT